MEKVKAIIYELHKKHHFHNAFLYILSFSNIIYLTYLLIIAYHNVILVDDYWFMAKYKQYGLLGSIAWWYQNWQGRFSPQLFTNIIVKSYELIHTLLPYTIFLITLFIYSIWKLINRLLPSDQENSKHYRLLVLNYSVFLFNLFLITNFEFSTFYWINVSTMYFGGVAFALLATGELISKSKSILSYFIVCIGFTYAGSSAEHFGALCTMVLVIYICVILNQQKIKLADMLNNIAINKALFAFIFCLSAFLIMILAPGNEERRAHFGKTSIFETSLIGFKSLFYVVTKLIPEKVKYLFILSFPFIYLGTLLRKKSTIDEFKISLIIAGSLPLFVFFLYACVLPTAYAIASVGPFRALTHIAFFIVLYIAILSFSIGYKTFFPKKLAYTLSLISCLSFMVISRDRIKTNLPETIKYSQSEKQRINKLLDLKAKGNKEVVTLDSLYGSHNNVLWLNEIADSKKSDIYWINQYLSEGLELGFEVKVRSRISCSH